MSSSSSKPLPVLRGEDLLNGELWTHKINSLTKELNTAREEIKELKSRLTEYEGIDITCDDRST
ncbi:hypothetical protein N7540_005540 [Penicillium herquei]|nr:hypothetical protein N7540_005540 [Penicillium herquei]